MKQFLVVGTQRTGSSAVAESLGLHPKVSCGWEWTLRRPWNKKFAIAERGLSGDFSLLEQDDQDHLKRVHNQQKAWIGFRWLFSSSAKWIIHPRFSPALWLDRLEGFIDWASCRNEIYIIHIVRHDCLDWLKSVYLAKKLKLFSKNRYPDAITVRIHPRQAVRRLISKKWIDSRLATLNHSNPYLLINYEDFLRDQKSVLSRVFDFIGCDNISLNLEARLLKKQSKKKTADYIENYTELAASLARRKLLCSEPGSWEGFDGKRPLISGRHPH